MLFVGCIGCSYIDHGAASPRLLRQVEEPAGVVVDDMKPALAGADVEVAMNPDAKARSADLRPRSTGYEVENAIVVPGFGKKTHEALWLPKVHRLVVAIARTCGRSADRTCCAIRIHSLHVLAIAAQPYDDGRPQRVRILDCKRPLPSVVGDTDRRVDRPLFYRLRTGRKHA